MRNIRILTALKMAGVVTLASAVTAAMAVPAQATGPQPDVTKTTTPAAIVVAGHSYKVATIFDNIRYLATEGNHVKVKPEAAKELSAGTYSEIASFARNTNIATDEIAAH